ncbi:hypothetical protein [Streptomyces sp. NPDC017890]|uniref:hypothetical protein n=1 Tax=Streptomyces sp. NPDC017890 TaxID=3365015 RepID=UPI00378C9F2B
MTTSGAALLPANAALGAALALLLAAGAAVAASARLGHARAIVTTGPGDHPAVGRRCADPGTRPDQHRRAGHPAGAFIGMLLGGAPPLVAGAVRLSVLPAVESAAVVVVPEPVARAEPSRRTPGT